MCNFVPGEVVAIGPRTVLAEIGEGLPGTLGPVLSLISEIGEAEPASELGRLGSITLKTDHGTELFALSHLSARLSGAIKKNQAIVDLNHILPLASSSSDLMPTSLRLSQYGESEVLSIRRFLRDYFSKTPTKSQYSPRIGVLDSGISPDYRPYRPVNYLDYSNNGQLRKNSDPQDPLGHGTRVAYILDQILPPEVELIIGRLPSDTYSLTALNIARALGDMIARDAPDVVNLSVCTRTDSFLCPHCKQRSTIPSFFSSFLPLIIRLGGSNVNRTVTVMAAGNTGQTTNSRWLTEDVDSLLLATALNRRQQLARYSSTSEGPRSDLYTVPAFGGDDPDDPEAEGVFADGTHGTSFSAPFVSAISLYAKKDIIRSGTKGYSDLGTKTREVLNYARSRNRSV